MTRGQFAWAVGGTEKWVENSARLLRLRLEFTPVEARWLGMVRLLTEAVGVPLSEAARLARKAMHLDPHQELAIVGAERTGAGVAVFLARYYSTHAASLSAALELGGARRRGRRRPSGRGEGAIARAATYGVDIELLREGLKLSPGQRLERASENAEFVAALRRQSA